MYAAKKIPSNEMAKEREIPSWPPANCENPSVPQTLNEDDDHPNSICPNGTIHTFDCHFSERISSLRKWSVILKPICTNPMNPKSLPL